MTVRGYGRCRAVCPAMKQLPFRRHSMVRGLSDGDMDCTGHGIVYEMQKYGADGVSLI
jgi:heterodisulfide reductase subunit C